MKRISLLAAIAAGALGAGASGVLPVEYAELLWLESTGTQFIDTGVCFGNANGYSITYQNMANVNDFDGNPVVCGSRLDAGDTRCLVGSNWYGRKDRLECPMYDVSGYVGWNTLKMGPYATPQSLVSDIERGTLWVNYENSRQIDNRGAQFMSLSAGDVLSAQTCPFYLFAGNIAYQEAPLFGACRIMNFRMTSDKNLIMHLVPARRRSGDALGMYDLVGRRFLENGGTGTFIAGPEVPSGPDAYIRLDYLESWHQQVIDTGVLFTDEHGYSITYQPVAHTSNDNICGSRASSGDTRCVVGANGVNDGFTYVGWNTLVVKSDEDHLADAGVGTVKVNYRNSREIDCRGTKRSLVGNTLTPQTGTFWLFGGHYSYSGQPNVYCRYRIMDFEMTKGAETIMHLVPARRKIDWQTGMYDTVNDRFYPGGGPGNFAVPSPPLPENYAEVDYVESDGTSYIDTEVKNTSSVRSEVSLYLASNAESVHLFGARTAFKENAHGLSFQVEKETPGFACAWGSQVLYGWQILNGALTNAVGDTFHTFTLGDRRHWIDGLTHEPPFSPQSYTTDLNIYAFALNNNGTPHNQKTPVRLSLVRMWEDDACVRSMVPVVDLGTMTPGLYDLVEGKFHGNAAGGGAFRFGNFTRGVAYTNVLEDIWQPGMDNAVSVASGQSTNFTLRVKSGRYLLIFKHWKDGAAPTLRVALGNETIATVTPSTSRGRLTANHEFKVTRPDVYTLSLTGSGAADGTARVCDAYLYLLEEIPCGSVLVFR